MTDAPARPPLTLAAIGPPRQGKSTLAAALSRILGRRRGAPGIDLRALLRGGNYRRDGGIETQAARWLEYTTETARVAHLDLAGRTRRAITRWAPLSWADAILLVISPGSGANPSDAGLGELLRIAAHHGVARAIVFVNQCDRHDDPELIDLAELEARALLDGCGFDGDATPVIRGAALPALADDPRWERSIVELADALDRWLVPPPRDPAAPLRVSVLRGYTIYGRGRVAAARIERGVLRAGDPIDVLGTSHHRWVRTEERLVHLRRRVESLRSFDRVVTEGRPGELVGALIPARPGVSLGWRELYRVSRGLVITAPDALALRRELTVRARLLAPEEGGWPRDLERRFEGACVIGAASETATITAVDGRARPGEELTLAIELGWPIPIGGDERVLLRRQDRLIGLGVVVPPLGPAVSLAIDE